MDIKRLFKHYVSLFVFLFIAFSCDRTEELTFEDFDTDENNVITEEEFENVFTAHYYDDWNNVDDEYLDDEDFYLSVYDVWDADDDELLDEEEWTMGYDYYYGDYVISDYDAIDIDGDGFIEYTEYNDVLVDTDFFVDWDADADDFLNEDELAEGVFHIWDLNNDGMLDREEYIQFDSYYLDI
jgi:Ca2+-binding EF-hand superfamily protein